MFTAQCHMLCQCSLVDKLPPTIRACILMANWRLQREFVTLLPADLAVTFFWLVKHFECISLVIGWQFLLLDLVLRCYVLVQCVLALISFRALRALEDLLGLSVLFVGFAIHLMILQRPFFFERFSADFTNELFLLHHILHLFKLLLNLLNAACRHEHVVEHHSVFSCVETGPTLDWETLLANFVRWERLPRLVPPRLVAVLRLVEGGLDVEHAELA